MIELDDCGKEFHLTDYWRGFDAIVQMVIKAPRGSMALFNHNYTSPDTQCEAIRAFMEEHSDKA